MKKELTIIGGFMGTTILVSFAYLFVSERKENQINQEVVVLRYNRSFFNNNFADINKLLRERDAQMLDYFDVELQYQKEADSLVKATNHRLATSEFVLITRTQYDIKYDFGDVNYLDSIKCIRYSEAKYRIKQFKTQKALEDKILERLNKSCE